MTYLYVSYSRLWFIFATRHFGNGEFLLEYVGERISAKIALIPDVIYTISTSMGKHIGTNNFFIALSLFK